MSFERSLSISDDIAEEINREARALSLNLLAGLTRVTPVDTGRARGNWFVGVNRTIRDIDKERRARDAMSEGQSNIGQAAKLDYPEVVLSNNLPYIERLNDGYSTQAPSKFIEKEIDRVVNAKRVIDG